MNCLLVRTLTHSSVEYRDLFIIGAGCVGKSLTASLLKSSHQNRVFLISKKEHVEKIKYLGINLIGGVTQTFMPSDRFIVAENIDHDLLKNYNIHEKPIIFLSTKAADVASSVSLFKKVVNDISPPIICLQNGLGVEEEVIKACAPLNAKVFKGHVFAAVHQKDNDLFAYKGRIIIETPDEHTEKKLNLIFGPKGSSLFDLEISSDILKAIYPKLTVNCVCNALTVILNINLGEILKKYESLIRMICSEVYTVALSQGISLGSNEELENLVLDTMSKYSTHFSSMHLDHQLGKKTEIEYINGAIVKIANEKHLEVPVNRFLTDSIKDIEFERAKYISVEEYEEKNRSRLECLRIELEKFPGGINFEQNLNLSVTRDQFYFF